MAQGSLAAIAGDFPFGDDLGFGRIGVGHGSTCDLAWQS
jgi:hypothetical protein